MWARIEGNTVAELSDHDPSNRYHPSLKWVACHDQVEVGWLYINANFQPTDPAELTAAAVKEKITRFRWEVETGGITLPGGMKVATALDDQNRITTVVANARLAGLEQVKFKAASGWVTLTMEEVEGIAAAIAQHVQACFTAECAHHDAIDAIALIPDPAERQAALDDYDETLGWPGDTADHLPAL